MTARLIGSGKRESGREINENEDSLRTACADCSEERKRRAFINQKRDPKHRVGRQLTETKLLLQLDLHTKHSRILQPRLLAQDRFTPYLDRVEALRHGAADCAYFPSIAVL